ncbi:MAG TPA: hypothetical protein DCS07_03690 [Bdellovibrionales bacterium]|nr:MAG: hypothetical protein A2Z97_00840 [Bdellovibrionales bacterium GWB1_52_6]OFZ05193.1 MAG: hypothetical protein A2X97_10395 [Bdellovibrionales bacterium GWA1_52_35]OFZ39272.1 MAG: hypothetical protein A2070_13280 [Bdellovibrionales bacterium GWC1_52_8]HAR41721.1 hypothetical protein [Bdellovibrionales bacterium]HCM38676.1 hypothetical protein [Bdellovibrionales bacterium]
MVDEKPPGKSPLGGVRAAANMLSGLDAAARARILANIAQRDPKLAAEIQKNLFTFEDLTRLSTWDIQKLMSKIPMNILALALRNSPQEIKDFAFQNLSERTGKILQEEIQTLGPRRVSEIEAAQEKIVALAKELLEIHD